MAHMFIINPLSGLRADALFSTHPNTQNRIAALEAIAQRNGALIPCRRLSIWPVGATFGERSLGLTFDSDGKPFALSTACPALALH